MISNYHTEVILLFLQVMLTYSSLRAIAIEENGYLEHINPLPLPPSALKIAIFLLIFLPILADLQNQFVLASPSGKIVQEMSSNSSSGKDQYITVTQISVRSGPAEGDDVVGFLPKGTCIQVLDQKHGWVCIGKSRWISNKFLRPVIKG